MPTLNTPTIWHIPYQRNPCFTGREDVLTQLHSALHAENTVALSHPQVQSRSKELPSAGASRNWAQSSEQCSPCAEPSSSLYKPHWTWQIQMTRPLHVPSHRTWRDSRSRLIKRDSLPVRGRLDQDY